MRVRKRWVTGDERRQLFELSLTLMNISADSNFTRVPKN